MKYYFNLVVCCVCNNNNGNKHPIYLLKQLALKKNVNRNAMNCIIEILTNGNIQSNIL